MKGTKNTNDDKKINEREHETQTQEIPKTKSSTLRIIITNDIESMCSVICSDDVIVFSLKLCDLKIC